MGAVEANDIFAGVLCCSLCRDFLPNLDDDLFGDVAPAPVKQKLKTKASTKKKTSKQTDGIFDDDDDGMRCFNSRCLMTIDLFGGKGLKTKQPAKKSNSTKPVKSKIEDSLDDLFD